MHLLHGMRIGMARSQITMIRQRIGNLKSWQKNLANHRRLVFSQASALKCKFYSPT